MRILVDTHVALWWLDNHQALGCRARQAIAAADQVLFSAVTPWELGIKRAVGRVSFADGLAAALLATGFEELPITSQHAERAAALPLHHNDPFDRMLIAQAQMEALTLVTADRDLRRYDLDVIDARR